MNMPENSTLLNVCIIPDKRVSAECVEISQSLKNDETMFVLGEGFFAHMTVYMARFAINEIDKVVRGVETALQSVRSFKCEHAGYFMTAGRYYEVSYRKSDEFMKLQESIIQSVADLRINPGNPYEEGYFTPYSAGQQQNAKETGYDLARDLYRPHITITRYREGGLPTILPDTPPIDLSFSLSKVCVYKADDNGAVHELVHEFHVAQ